MQIPIKKNNTNKLYFQILEVDFWAFFQKIKMDLDPLFTLDPFCFTLDPFCFTLDSFLFEDE